MSSLQPHNQWRFTNCMDSIGSPAETHVAAELIDFDFIFKLTLLQPYLTPLASRRHTKRSRLTPHD